VRTNLSSLKSIKSTFHGKSPQQGEKNNAANLPLSPINPPHNISAQHLTFFAIVSKVRKMNLHAVKNVKKDSSAAEGAGKAKVRSVKGEEKRAPRL